MEKEFYEVTFKIELERYPNMLIMFQHEMVNQIKYVLHKELEDYFKKFKVSNFKCKRVKPKTTVKK